MTDRPQLHVSMLNTMARCGIQFQRRYGARFGIWDREEIIPPSIALVTGISVHQTVEKDLKSKLETGSLLLLSEAQEVARDSVARAALPGMVTLDDDETKRPFDKVVGETIDQTVKLITLHHNLVAPEINLVPGDLKAAIEKPFVITMPGYPVDLGGKIDVVESNNCLRDTKTAGRSPAAGAAKSIQMAMYATAHRIETGSLPDKVSLDFLVKTKTPKVAIDEAIPDENWMKPLFFRIERAIEIIEAVKEGKKALSPAQPDDWTCTARHCGYASTCPFYSGR